MTQLSKAVVLITGAAGGFGQELTRQLLALESQLILTDIDQERLEETTRAIAQSIPPSSQGKILACLEADLASRQGCDRLYSHVQTLCQTLGRSVDVVINNAGIAMYGRMDEVPQDRWE
ncbi:SDR family oxidoreductase, partial [Okeania sp. SIO2G5]|uniref:SDR family NAD(P)-dependent oxidoreductase n=1 Tax=Okeania sp. SIO2G5 TaxID=2607796 RepID=UPI0013BF9C99